MKFILFFVLQLAAILPTFPQSDSVSTIKDYSVVIRDSPSLLFTMRQTNETYLSCSRLVARGLYDAFKKDVFPDILQAGLTAFFFMPMTHEEGHRSILTAQNIGSISQPYFNNHGAAYVRGVTDHTLMDLRDRNLPVYIRLHTAGLESDYMLTKREESMGSFMLDDFKNLKWEYWIRKLAILNYYVTGLFEYEFDLEEEDDELERDIVGYDTYGAARHLYRPAVEFHRYTLYTELTDDERSFVKRMGYRSLLNLLNPMLVGKSNFKLTENLRMNIGMGYTLAPFGDFIDENIWLKYKKFNIALYARQFQNRNKWFPGFGLSLAEYQLQDRILFSVAGHFWQQPDNYDFNTSGSFNGGALDLCGKYFFLVQPDHWLKGFSLDLGLVAKTKGYLPEEVFLEEHIGLRFGTTFRL